ncbi:MAG: hypothetical protein ACTTJ3_00910 [Treponema sp.]
MVKKLLVVLLGVSFFSLVFLSSCKQRQELDDELSSSSGLVTPYSDMDDFSLARSVTFEDETVVNWKVARFFALLKKIDFESIYTWHGANLSEYPIIIYYADSNKPRYYEFRVIKEGKEVGSITCNASKLEGSPIAYVSEMTHKVPIETAKQLVSASSTLKLSNVNYPSQFVMREATITSRSVQNGEVQFKDALTGNLIDSSNVFIEKSTLSMLQEADDVALKRLEITTESKEIMLKEETEKHEKMVALWKAIDEITPKILETSDEEVENEYVNPSPLHLGAERWVVGSQTTQIEKVMLDDWYNKRNWWNPGGWCGPSAVTFIALGLGRNAGFNKIPLYDDSYAIKELYQTFLGTIGSGPRVISELGNGLASHTNYTIEQKLSHRWDDVTNNIKGYKLPVVSLRSGWYGDWGFHYRTIIGYEIDCRTDWHKISWWFFGWWENNWTTDTYSYWYYMHDNTSDADGSGNFWEEAGGVFQSTLGLVKRYR